MVCCNYIQYLRSRKLKCNWLSQRNVLIDMQSTRDTREQGSAEMMGRRFSLLWLQARVLRFA